MAELTPEIAAEIVAAAQANAEEAAGALSRALDGQFTMSVGENATFDKAAPPEDYSGPGIAIVMSFGDAAAVALLTQATGLTPDWAPSPDPTGESKLATLAQELSMLLVPDSFMADTFEAAWVEDLGKALERGKLADNAAVVPLSLVAESTGGTLWLLWPLSAPAEVLKKEETDAGPEPSSEESAGQSPAAEANTAEADTATRIFDISQLPSHCRSLLKVQAPLSVALADKKYPMQDIMRLGVGSILSFDQPCDAPLDVFVGNQRVAEGEAVKVGEHFGVKIKRMVMPEEHFRPLLPKEAG